ncbi:hypothetical protein BKA80DRAFT_274632 [Phyllosticta citrichinensis]
MAVVMAVRRRRHQWMAEEMRPPSNAAALGSVHPLPLTPESFCPSLQPCPGSSHPPPWPCFRNCVQFCSYFLFDACEHLLVAAHAGLGQAEIAKGTADARRRDLHNCCCPLPPAIRGQSRLYLCHKYLPLHNYPHQSLSGTHTTSIADRPQSRRPSRSEEIESNLTEIRGNEMEMR